MKSDPLFPFGRLLQPQLEPGAGFRGGVNSLRGEIELRRSGALKFLTRLKEAERAAGSSLEEFQSAGEKGGVARALCAVAGAVGTQGRHKRSEELFRKAIKAGRLVGDRQVHAIALGNLGAVLAETGRLEEARTALEEAVQLCRTPGQVSHRSLFLHNLGSVTGSLGNLDVAKSLFRRALKSARKSGDRMREIAALRGLGTVETEEHRLESAVKTLKGAVGLAREIGSTWQEGHTGWFLADALSACGRHAEALETMERSLRIALANGDAPLHAHCRHGLGRLIARSGDRNGARREYLGAIGQFKAMGWKVKASDVQRELAEMESGS